MIFRLSHLAILLAVALVLATVGGVAATWWVAGREFRDVLDDDLKDQSKLLAELLASGRFMPSPRELRTLLKDVFEADDEDTLWVSVYDLAGGPMTSNLEHNLPLESAEDGPLSRRHDGYGWHGYQEHENGLVVQLLRRDDRYRQVREDVLEDIVTPALAGSGVTLLLLAALILLFLRPVTRLARELETRSADSLAPLNVDTPAYEIRVLRDSLNKLMHNVEEVLARERRFAGDVAHELRTPLTTLKLELANPAPDLPALRSEVARLARLVEQLLTLARLEQGALRRNFAPVELAALCAGVVRRLGPKFGAAGMSVQEALSPATVQADAVLLEILVQNLLQNVLNHCPRGTQVELRVECNAGSARLSVSDTGPGIPEEIRRRMERGFTRLDRRSEGFGLGLAICRRITDVHGASLGFRAPYDGASGLVVEVEFGT